MDESSADAVEGTDVTQTGFPLAPDDEHLQHVGKTKQGNGYWIDFQLAVEDGKVRDFVTAYVFDKEGHLISCEVINCGLRGDADCRTATDVVPKLLAKIDATVTSEIWVKPFSRVFYGHSFGLVVREDDEGDDPQGETLIDALPGHTLMFYGPWDTCNYDS
ncbi:hypothetical protein ACMU_11180 [Actibacterium mucosum KCTC 23349]|uniref:Uncharacterized protein n=1 Tax=Actibacterium mucosum KCTC 23349 TaxID=1454373 RepID=A0A037ZFJ6_9RHOB|nr:hypothetical protein [Actibacterium mucosum]KAJ55255.1 hypothetical protein ACMU_11180 [Actibacterium mucosum KCTC 23349]